MSDVPNEPGLYLWRSRPSEWAARRVYVETGWHFKVPTLCVGVRTEGGREAGTHPVAVDDDRLGGEWGERIPGNEVLEARREMAARDPYEWHMEPAAEAGWTCEGRHCRYCLQDEGKPHAPYCPWLRAQGD